MRRREIEAAPEPFEKRVLEELVFERVRGAVNTCALIVLQTDLSASVERVTDGDETGEGHDFVMECLRRAWGRVTEDVLADLAAHDFAIDLDPDAPM
jgi:hypothetical protein